MEGEEKGEGRGRERGMGRGGRAVYLNIKVMLKYQQSNKWQPHAHSSYSVSCLTRGDTQ